MKIDDKNRIRYSTDTYDDTHTHQKLFSHSFRNPNEQSLKLLTAALNIGVLLSSF